MITSNPTMLSKYQPGKVRWPVGYIVDDKIFAAGGTVQQRLLILPNGYRVKMLPQHHAFFCEICGDLWGKICLNSEAIYELSWELMLVDCAMCGNGSMILHGGGPYSEQINAAMPLKVLERELDIEIQKAEALIKPAI